MSGKIGHLIDMGMKGFVLSSGMNRHLVPDSILGMPLEFIDSDDPVNLRFSTLFNIMNGVAFGDKMGMPLWVMLDCVLLPSMFVGIKGPAKFVPEQKRQMIDAAFSQYLQTGENPINQVLKKAGMPDISGRLKDDELVPLAEFCALPTYDKTRVVGMSLYNICSGSEEKTVGGLGRISKCLGLALYRRLGAVTQIGITQYDSASLTTHTCFGSIELVQVLTPIHTKADRTFVYSLTIPDEKSLQKIIVGERLISHHRGEQHIIKASDIWRLREMANRHREGTHKYYVVAPGFDKKAGGACVMEEKVKK
jgi:hypothetical protein